MKKTFKTIARAAAAILPYAGMAALAEVAHPALAAAGGTPLAGVTTGANVISSSVQVAGTAMGVAAIAWGAVHLVTRNEDWMGGLMRIGGGGVCAYAASNAQAISTALAGGATF